MKSRRGDCTFQRGESTVRTTDGRRLRDALEDDDVSEALQRLHHESAIAPNRSNSVDQQDKPLVERIPR